MPKRLRTIAISTPAVRASMKWIACILLGLVFLTGAQGDEVWNGQEKLTESQVVDLLATAIGDHVTGQPLAGIEFRHFDDAAKLRAVQLRVSLFDRQ